MDSPKAKKCGKVRMAMLRVDTTGQLEHESHSSLGTARFAANTLQSLNMGNDIMDFDDLRESTMDVRHVDDTSVFRGFSQ